MSEILRGGSWAGGWDEPGVLSVVLIAGGIPGSGLFVYSGAPALGNLTASIAAASGTDLYGNTYYSGICQYLPSGSATATLVTRMIDGQFLAGSAAAMAAWPAGPVLPGTIEGTTPASGELILNSGAAGGGDTVMQLLLQSATSGGNGTPQATLQGILSFLSATNPTSSGTYLWANSGTPGALITSGRLNAVNPTTVGTPETWTTMSGFLNNWAATGNTPRYRLGVENRVYFDGALDATNATAATFLTMPAAYRPVSPTKLWAGGANAGVPAGQA